MTTAAYDDALLGVQAGIHSDPQDLFSPEALSHVDEPRTDSQTIRGGLELEDDSDSDEDAAIPSAIDDVHWEEPEVALQYEPTYWAGDRVLANQILFLRDAAWYLEFNTAIKEGDMGRVYEIIKVGSFEN